MQMPSPTSPGLYMWMYYIVVSNFDQNGGEYTRHEPWISKNSVTSREPINWRQRPLIICHTRWYNGQNGTVIQALRIVILCQAIGLGVTAFQDAAKELYASKPDEPAELWKCHKIIMSPGLRCSLIEARLTKVSLAVKGGEFRQRLW
jgi:hypothetical protein